MKIVLTGVETNNKGAELMLYAILQEIERKYPDACVYISPYSVMQGLDYIKTSLKFRFWPYSKLMKLTHINGILRRLYLPAIEGEDFVKADYVLDGSGFLFSDQTKLWGTTPEWWEKRLSHQSEHGAKIVFLPQAIGPIENESTKHAIAVLNRYADVIMPRERVSYNYIKDSELVDMKKVRMFTDFTSVVDGVFPSKYEHLKNGICVIPNMRMIDQGKITYEDYVNLLSAIISEGKRSGHPVYLLNHEGEMDESLAYQCKKSVAGEIEVVTGLNALQVKGLIASAYVVVTSRFHGLASSLNSCVPSLATSWSHKYEELYNDYQLHGYVLPLNHIDAAVDKVKEILDEKENKRIRKHLSDQVPRIKNQTHEMWNLIWSL